MTLIIEDFQFGNAPPGAILTPCDLLTHVKFHKHDIHKYWLETDKKKNQAFIKRLRKVVR